MYLEDQRSQLEAERQQLRASQRQLEADTAAGQAQLQEARSQLAADRAALMQLASTLMQSCALHPQILVPYAQTSIGPICYLLVQHQAVWLRNLSASHGAPQPLRPQCWGKLLKDVRDCDGRQASVSKRMDQGWEEGNCVDSVRRRSLDWGCILVGRRA